MTNLKDFTETTVKFGGSLLKRLMNAESMLPSLEESKTGSFTALELEQPANPFHEDEVTPLSIFKKAKDGLSIGVNNVSQSQVAQATAKNARSIGRSIWGYFSQPPETKPTTPANQRRSAPKSP